MTKDTFYPGDIRSNYQGDEVAFIFQERGFIRTSLVSKDLGDLIRATRKEPISRVYFGINIKGSQFVHDNYTSKGLRSLDEELVSPKSLPPLKPPVLIKDSKEDTS